jgi:hypothetical protein
MSRKESFKDEALKKASELRPPSSLRAPSAASRVCDERPRYITSGPPLTPLSAPCGAVSLDNADAVIDPLPATASELREQLPTLRSSPTPSAIPAPPAAPPRRSASTSARAPTTSSRRRISSRPISNAPSPMNPQRP